VTVLVTINDNVHPSNANADLFFGGWEVSIWVLAGVAVSMCFLFCRSSMMYHLFMGLLG